MMRYYELTYLVSPDLSREEIKSLEEEISSLIQKEGGFIAEVKLVLKKKLSFPIMKYKETFLNNLNFHLPQGKLENLEKKLKSDRKILRHLILSKKLVKKEAVPIMKSKGFVKPKTKEKVELKEIEKKLEEILGE